MYQPISFALPPADAGVPDGEVIQGEITKLVNNNVACIPGNDVVEGVKVVDKTRLDALWGVYTIIEPSSCCRLADAL